MLQIIDMDEACEFYRDVLGFKLKFRNGDARAAFDLGSITLELVSRDHYSSEGALNFQVSDLENVVQRSLWSGARLVGDINIESRFSIKDPSGNILSFSPTTNS